MSKVRIGLVFALVLLIANVSAFAANYAVGTCKPSLPSFTTISAAVAAVPAFSTVLVCPGTYNEQVTINTPLNLQGITSGNSAQAIVAAPGGGLSSNVTSIFQGPLAAQVGVTVGPVNITNLTVDGSNNNLNGSSWLAGIFYQGGSSGVVNEVLTRNQLNSGAGVGVWVENGTSTLEGITVQNSTMHDFDSSGIVAGTFDSTTFIVKLLNNTVIAGSANGLDWDAGGTASGNIITGGSGFGAIFHQNLGTVAGNTIANAQVGIVAFASGSSDTSNKISNSTIGISFAGNGQTVKANTISESSTGIDFGCTTGNTVSGNKINDAGIGINNVPSAFSGANSFFNVSTVRNNGCGFAPKLPKANVRIPTMAH